MSLNLMKASHQWATRPADERFASVQEMHNACLDWKHKSWAEESKARDIEVFANGDELKYSIGYRNVRLSNWSFSQICNMVKAPSEYLETLPADLAVKNLNHGFNEHLRFENGEKDLQVLMTQTNGNEDILCRAITTPIYKRIWNSDLTERLMYLLDIGWRIPPARPAMSNQPGTRRATNEDILNCNKFSLSIEIGDLIAPAGLYASDRDMFAFLVDPERVIDDGSEGGLRRGFFLWNSEVGSASVGLQTFLWRHVCGNHIVWDASDVKIFKARHVGDINNIFTSQFQNKLVQYQNSSSHITEERIRQARQVYLGKNKDDVVDTIRSSKKKIRLGKKFLELAFDSTADHKEDGDPYTVWGMVNGITRESQKSEWADQRVDIDQESGKVMALAT